MIQAWENLSLNHQQIGSLYSLGRASILQWKESIHCLQNDIYLNSKYLNWGFLSRFNQMMILTKLDEFINGNFPIKTPSFGNLLCIDKIMAMMEDLRRGENIYNFSRKKRCQIFLKGPFKCPCMAEQTIIRYLQLSLIISSHSKSLDIEIQFEYWACEYKS